MRCAATVLLFTQTPAFFERTDTWFNRRGVDVFCAFTLEEAGRIAATRRIDLMLTQGVPGGVRYKELRATLPAQIPIIMLASGADDIGVLATYQNNGARVLHDPWGSNEVSDIAAELLPVPPRHYLRVLVQLQVDGNSAGFGFSNDVSMTGMLLETKRQLEIGQEVQVSFLLPGAARMTTTQALVVRQAGIENGAGRFGVKFIGLAADDQSFVASLSQRGEPRRRASA